jgi:hypothetical protein
MSRGEVIRYVAELLADRRQGCLAGYALALASLWVLTVTQMCAVCRALPGGAWAGGRGMPECRCC